MRRLTCCRVKAELAQAWSEVIAPTSLAVWEQIRLFVCFAAFKF